MQAQAQSELGSQFTSNAVQKIYLGTGPVGPIYFEQLQGSSPFCYGHPHDESNQILRQIQLLLNELSLNSLYLNNKFYYYLLK